MKKLLLVLVLMLGLGFSYTRGYTVYPNLECDNLIVNSTVNATVGTFTTGTISTTMNYDIVTSNATLTTGNINIPIKVKGITYYIKAHTGL